MINGELSLLKNKGNSRSNDAPLFLEVMVESLMVFQLLPKSTFRSLGAVSKTRLCSLLMSENDPCLLAALDDFCFSSGTTFFLKL